MLTVSKSDSGAFVVEFDVPPPSPPPVGAKFWCFRIGNTSRRFWTLEEAVREFVEEGTIADFWAYAEKYENGESEIFVNEFKVEPGTWQGWGPEK